MQVPLETRRRHHSPKCGNVLNNLATIKVSSKCEMFLVVLAHVVTSLQPCCQA